MLHAPSTYRPSRWFMRVEGDLHEVVRITLPSRGPVESTVMVRDLNTDEISRVKTRDLIQS